VIIKKSYEKFRTKLCKTYVNITGILRKRKISDVIQETFCQRLLLVKYFELK